MPRSWARSWTPALVLLAALAAPDAALGAGPRYGEPPPALVSGRGALEVAQAGGEPFRAPLPEGVAVHSVAALEPGAWLAAGTRDGSALVLLRGAGAELERVAGPEAGGPQVAGPVALAAGGELVGLAWLAGDDPGRLAVRFAPWLGGSLIGPGGGAWGEPEPVAGVAAGSQLALAGTVLADGSLLLAWSAFDGEDDEILWSLRAGGRWREPERLGEDNRVPDVTPAVAPLGEGALAVWSRYDGGEYRLVAARWNGERWSPPEPIAPPGSVYPALLAAGGETLLLYRDARRGGWTALRLGREARVAARAFLGESPPGPAPAVLGAGPDGVRLARPQGRETTVIVPWAPLP